MRISSVLSLVVVLICDACGGGASSSGKHDGDLLHAWAVGLIEDGGIILESHDSGNTWVTARTVARGLEGVTFVGSENGWAVGKGLILHTANGGDSWTTQVDGSDSFVSVAFVSTTRGVVVGRALPTSGTFGERLVLFTDDGGVQWTRAPIASGGRQFGMKVFLSFVCFTGDHATGIALGNGVDGNAVLLSTDAGQSWSDITTRVAEGGFPGGGCGPASLWVAQFEGGLYRSDDKGVTWKDVSGGLPIGFRGGLEEIVFVDNARGWAVGAHADERPVILRTTDGGDSWNEQPLAGSASGVLRGAAFVSPAEGAVVGSTSFSPPAPFTPLAFFAASGSDEWTRATIDFSEGILSDVAFAVE